jgi:hypothetical protein
MDKDDFCKSIDLDDMPFVTSVDCNAMQSLFLQSTGAGDKNIESYLARRLKGELHYYKFVYSDITVVIDDETRTVTFKPSGVEK